MSEHNSRFWSKVDKSRDCWLWTGGKSNTGYGAFNLGGRPDSAHRIAFVWERGEVPEGMVLDHICHNDDKLCIGGVGCIHRLCVNPNHLEVVTRGENVRRGKLVQAAIARYLKRTHCRNGHEMTEGNTFQKPNTSQRICRECHRIYQRRYVSRKLEASHL